LQPRFIYNWRSLVTTHQPVLYATAQRCPGPIAEFGCGHGSTPLLHEIAGTRGLQLVSLEDDPDWMSVFRSKLETTWHTFRLVEDWEEELRRPEWEEHWGLIFLDNEPWEARVEAALRLRDRADYVIIHDSDYPAEHGLFGTSTQPLRGARDRGTRDYSDLFSSWREYFPPEPWPWPPTGPPTLLGSNFRDVNEIPVDYLRHVPLWWRLGRHARGLAPQRVRMLIGNRIGWRVRPTSLSPKEK
jgi:hypothetical protein